MLTQLIIRNYAIVEALDMDFKSGMSVLTGETGAGKSIILGALGLTLGDRADKSVVRTGSKRAEICAMFELKDNTAARQWLIDHDLSEAEIDEESRTDSQTCLLRRLVNTDGRSVSYINGSPVTLGNLAELGDMLIDIHSQHEHQSLLRKSTHRLLLDEFGVDTGVIDDVFQCWTNWQRNQQNITTLGNLAEELAAQSQLVGYQLAELDDLAPMEGEIEDLEQEFLSLDNAENTVSTLQQALTICRDDEDYNLNHGINQVLTLITSQSRTDNRFAAVQDLLNTAAIQIDEACLEIQRLLDHLDINPQRLEWVNERMADLHRVARKHKVKPNELYQLQLQLKQQLDSYKKSDGDLEKFRRQDLELRTQYQKLADKLSQLRRQAATKLASQINKQLTTLGMSEAKLEVSLPALPGTDPAAHGLENIEFLISTNPGQAAKSLAKVASGGELSRISLAIQVVTAQTSKTPTLVFDEVDVGIGGGIAKVVGKLLRQLADHTQILCVTHQAQVASQGHQHYFVSKKTSGKITNTAITQLNDSEKVKEVARMLGGEEFTNASLAHAEQMVSGV